MEAILASFMLLTAIIMSVAVFDSSLQAEASNERRIIASMVAESALAELRDAVNTNMTAAIDRAAGGGISSESVGADGAASPVLKVST